MSARRHGGLSVMLGVYCLRYYKIIMLCYNNAKCCATLSVFWLELTVNSRFISTNTSTCLLIWHQANLLEVKLHHSICPTEISNTVCSVSSFLFHFYFNLISVLSWFVPVLLCRLLSCGTNFCSALISSPLITSCSNNWSSRIYVQPHASDGLPSLHTAGQTTHTQTTNRSPCFVIGYFVCVCVCVRRR